MPLITQSSIVTEPTHTPVARQAQMAALLNWQQMREREREKLHYVHSASLAYEDGYVFMSGPFAEWL